MVKDAVDEKLIKLKYIPTEAMVADLLTKPLQGRLFKRLRAAMTNSDSDYLCGGVSVNSDVGSTEISNIVDDDDTLMRSINNASRSKANC